MGKGGLYVNITLLFFLSLRFYSKEGVQIVRKEEKGETEKGIRQDYMQIAHSVHEAYILSKKAFENVEYFLLPPPRPYLLPFQYVMCFFLQKLL
jgi:hypothetical protein